MDPTEFQAMVDAEEHHWWYRGRRLIVRCQLDRLLARPGLELLDAGCGSGRMMDELDSHTSVSGLDSNPRAVALARARGHPRVRLGRVEEMPYREGNFDVVTCLDVLEHTRDDVRSLRELRRVTRAGGHLVVTVPAYRFLWSTHDVANQHYRRYRRSALRAAAREAGWEVVSDTYFNSVLFAPAALLRLLRRVRAKGRERSDLALTPSWLDRALVVPMRLEAFLLRRGVRLPAGLSLLAVLRNPDRPQIQSAKEDDRGRVRARSLLRAGSQEMSWQFVKFLVVGASNTLISLIAYVLAVRSGVPYLLASIAAFSLGAVNGYSLNRVWTFRAGAFAPSGLLRYGVVQTLGLVVNALLLLALVEGTRLDRILAQAVVLPLVSVLTFALNRSWAFRSGRARWHRDLATASDLPSDLGAG